MTPTLLVAAAVLLRILSNPLANVFQKKLTNAGQSALWVNLLTYSLLSLGCAVLALGVPWSRLPPSFYGWSLLVGLAGGLGNGFLVKALELGDLSVLGPINAYKSVVGIITGILLLGEWPNGWGLAGVALIIWGSYYVLGGGSGGFNSSLLRQKEIRYRLLALVLTAIEAVFLKKVIQLSDPNIAFISWCWAGAVCSLVIWLLMGRKSAGSQASFSFTMMRQLVPLVLCIGIMQWCTNYVFDHMAVGYALALFQLSALVSVGLGYRLFNEGGIRRKLVGSLIMVAGSVLIILMSK